LWKCWILYPWYSVRIQMTCIKYQRNFKSYYLIFLKKSKLFLIKFSILFKKLIFSLCNIQFFHSFSYISLVLWSPILLKLSLATCRFLITLRQISFKPFIPFVFHSSYALFCNLSIKTINLTKVYLIFLD
jgi:hypothetical protein